MRRWCLVNRLGRTITPYRPLILLGWEGPPGASGGALAAAMLEEWRGIPPLLQSCAALIFGATDPNFDLLAHTADDEGIPYFAQVRTWMPPHIPSFALQRSWREETVSTGAVRAMYHQYPGLAGVQAVELNCFGLSGEERRYIAELIEISAEYGGLLSWQEANDGCNLWVEVGADRELYRCIEAHPDILLPQWEMNVPKSMYLCHDSVMGLWLAGAVDNWGAEPQSWYWLDAGYTDLNSRPGEFDRGYRAGDRRKCPDGLWGQMILLGASSGATVYSIEPYRGVVAAEDGRGYATAWTRAIGPLLQWLITERAIPDRATVHRKVRVAYHADFENAAFAERSDIDCYRQELPDDHRMGAHTARGRGSGLLYEGTYRLPHPFKMIPETGRYFWIPVLPKYASSDALLSFPEVLSPNAFAAAREVSAYFDRCYAPDGQGEAWIVCVGGTAFISQTHENLDTEQHFAVGAPLPMAIEGTLRAHQYIVARRSDKGGLSVHLGNYAGRTSRLLVHPGTNQAPPTVIEARDSLTHPAKIQTRLSGNALEITVSHHGAVDLSLE